MRQCLLLGRWLLLLEAWLLWADFGHAQIARPRIDEMLSFGNSVNAFSKDLFKSLGSKGNAVISPMSVFSTMSMTSAAAQGQTRSQIVRALNLSPDQLTRNSAMAYVTENLQSRNDDGLKLETVNYIWVPQGVSVKSDFASTLQDVFGTKVRSADFSRPEEVRQLVNNRVSNVTRGKINQLLPPGALTPQTSVLLANAVYFKGLWLHPFNSSQTRMEPFVLDNSRSTLVSMMRINDTFRGALLDDLDAKAVYLPYQDGRFGLVLLLPNQYDGIRDLESAFFRSNHTVTTLLNRMIHRDVDLSLPKFQIKFQSDVSAALQRMGITDLFSERADLSGLSSIAARNRLRASKFLHEANIDVNEGGSEASAASALEIIPLMGVPGFTGPIQFKADHPFLFFLVDADNGNLPIFMGRVQNPTSEMQSNDLEPPRSREQPLDVPVINRDRFSSRFPVSPIRNLRPGLDEIIFPQNRPDPFLSFNRLFNVPVPPQFIRRNFLPNRFFVDDLIFSPAEHPMYQPVAFPVEDEMEAMDRKKRQAAEAEDPQVDLRGDKFWFMKPAIPDLLIPINETKDGGSTSASNPSSGSNPKTPIALPEIVPQPTNNPQSFPAPAADPQSFPKPANNPQPVPQSAATPQRFPLPQPFNPNELNIFGGSEWSGSSASRPLLPSGSSPNFPYIIFLPADPELLDFPLPPQPFPNFPVLSSASRVSFPGLANRIQNALLSRT